MWYRYVLFIKQIPTVTNENETTMTKDLYSASFR